METVDLLRTLSSLPGVSGYEHRVADEVESVFRSFCDSTRQDKMGSVIGVKKGDGDGRRLSVMLAAHIDQIGLIVTKIEDGFLRVTEVGGVDPRTLIGQEVVIHGTRDIHGVVGAKPPHLLDKEEYQKAPKLKDLVVDPGLGEDELQELVYVGDLITVRRDFTKLQGERVAGNAMDDRAGVLVIYEALRALRRLRHFADVYAVGTVQEEVGLKGAITSTYGINPDLGIAIDVTHGAMPGLPAEDVTELGKGPAIALGPNIHPAIYERLVEIAKKYDIPYQVEPAAGPTGTDAWAMQITRAGIATGLISVPLRYMHTSVELLDLRDIIKSGQLLAEFIASIDPPFVEGLACF